MVQLQERFPSTIDKYEAKDFSYFFKTLDGLSKHAEANIMAFTKDM